MTDQTPSLDSLCETIRELLPKVTPLLAPEDVDGGTMVIDDPDSQTLSAVQTGDASPRAFGMWKKDAEFFAWCLIHRRLIALAPTMATALLSLASERAKQEAGSREAFEAWAIGRGIGVTIQRGPYGEYIDRYIWAMWAAWQAASKPAALNVEKAAEEIAARFRSTGYFRDGEKYLTPDVHPNKIRDAITTLLRKHLTEAPALSEEEKS